MKKKQAYNAHQTPVFFTRLKHHANVIIPLARCFRILYIFRLAKIFYVSKIENLFVFFVGFFQKGFVVVRKRCKRLAGVGRNFQALQRHHIFRCAIKFPTERIPSTIPLILCTSASASAFLPA